MTRGTVIPPWLYQNDLPDDELQEVYVQEAERKWKQVRDERVAAEREVELLYRQEVAALAFLNDALEALEKDQGPVGGSGAPRRRSRLLETGRPGLPAPPEGPDAEEAVFRPRRKRLPKP